MKFTDEQTELLALLPQDLKNSQELTDSARLVLSNIIFLYGMEDAQKNGYVYRTNSKMMEEINIKSEHTLIGAVRLLELLGYIETKRGKRNEASTYKLLINCSNKCSNNCSNNSEKCSNNCSNNCSNEFETLQNQILLLQKQVVLLQKEIENLKNCSKKCSTDTDIDEDIDKNNNNLSTIELKDLEPEVTEDKKENKKEKVNEMKNAVLNEMERKDNEIQTSTSSNETNNSNLQIDNKSDRNNSSALADDELFNEIFGVTSTGSENKAAGDVETRSMEQLPTSEDKNAPEDLKTQNNAYTLQDWMTEYQKLILQVENTDVEAVQFDTLLDEGCNLFENFPINEGNYKRQMQDLRLWVAKKVNYQKTIKISERWNKYYRAA